MVRSSARSDRWRELGRVRQELDADVCVRGARTGDIRVGDIVRVGLDLAHLHIFDAATGRRLEWQPDPTDAVEASVSAVQSGG